MLPHGQTSNLRMEFHISRHARERYQLDASLFSLSGNVIFANFQAARALAQKINQQRDLVRHPEQACQAGQINAMGLIDEILHYVVELYREQRNPDVMQKSLARLDERHGEEAVEAALRRFLDEFPPSTVYRGEISADDYLAGSTAGVPNRQVTLEEMALLWLANANPAFAPFRELFDHTPLQQETSYARILTTLYSFLQTQPPFGPDHQNLIDMLRAPAVAVPHSLAGQLEYIRERWGYLLGSRLFRVLGSLDLIQEETRIFFPAGPGPSRVYEFRGLEQEPERFSPDQDWMPRLVLIAKIAHVWLDQLSRKYGRSIARLDQIPDEELDLLARRGMTGLWLIGLWQRSPASRNIKEMMGNPEAVASAYSLFDYRIADDLGGEEAYQTLRDRAWQRGIRLASDMVPNHVGIDSRWVVEHPDWFISLPYNPYPWYSYGGPNLSWDERVGIYLEDHYYTRTDAAVVFRRVDNWTGSEQFIYHGNDGTLMPWNDTAQLNYLQEQVREAVIQTILAVARRFPIIRLDAAMTLAKRHYQRLWFPEPGEGGGIPTRSEFGLTKQQFDAAMPEEFWRQVVDRVAAEVPDTLLLAEAFWLMEGYFVRTLGMHRVYNSAFMNMLRDEENAKYRSVMKNTLEFDPEIMRRYVNFMNNADERTAVDQFGKGDKYFGICTLMATMPGLPMFGHGQIEGFAEKYGMEYRRPYWNEEVDSALVERHERQIFPLLRMRSVFAGVEDFLLYDFFEANGYVNEDVFAYSNRAGHDRALVVYHNKYSDTRGWIRTSAGYLDKGSGERRLVRRSLGEGLMLPADEDAYCIFRDHVEGMEYIRNCREVHEKGLFVAVGAYKHHVFLNFREVHDDARHMYRRLNAFLNGRGVASIEEGLREMLLEPIRQGYAELVNVDVFQRLLALRDAAAASETQGAPEGERAAAADAKGQELMAEVERKMRSLLERVAELVEGPGEPAAIAGEVRASLEGVLRWPRLVRPAESTGGAALPAGYGEAMEYLRNAPSGRTELWATIFAWALTRELGKMATPTDYEQQSDVWVDEWMLGRIVAGTLQDMGSDEAAGWHAVSTLRLLLAQADWYEDEAPAEGQARRVLERWLSDPDVQRYLQVNRYQEVVWFNKESMEQLLWWMMLVAASRIGADGPVPRGEAASRIARCYTVIQQIQRAAGESGYQVERLLTALQM